MKVSSRFKIPERRRKLSSEGVAGGGGHKLSSVEGEGEGVDQIEKFCCRRREVFLKAIHVVEFWAPNSLPKDSPGPKFSEGGGVPLAGGVGQKISSGAGGHKMEYLIPSMDNAYFTHPRL